MPPGKGHYGSSPGGARERQRGEIAVTRDFLKPLTPLIGQQLDLANRLMPQSDSNFTNAKRDLQEKCQVTGTYPDGLACSDAVARIAAIVKPRDENP